MFLGLPDPYVAAREEMNPGESGLWRVSSLVREVCCCSTRQLGREAPRGRFQLQGRPPWPADRRLLRRGGVSAAGCPSGFFTPLPFRALCSVLYRVSP